MDSHVESARRWHEEGEGKSSATWLPRPVTRTSSTNLARHDETVKTDDFTVCGMEAVDYTEGGRVGRMSARQRIS